MPSNTHVMSKACFSPFRSRRALVATVVLSLTKSDIERPANLLVSSVQVYERESRDD